VAIWDLVGNPQAARTTVDSCRTVKVTWQGCLDPIWDNLLASFLWVVIVAIVGIGARRVWKRSKSSPSITQVPFEQPASDIDVRTGQESYQQLKEMIPDGLRTLDVSFVEPEMEYVRPHDNSDPVATTAAVDRATLFAECSGRLLIVGEPGSGKTVALYRMIEDYHRRPPADPYTAVLVNLSAWQPTFATFEDFLVHTLCDQQGPYRNKATGTLTTAANDRRFAVFLDGLDEIAPEHRKGFVDTFERYMKKPSQAPVVLTCRDTEYQELSVKLGLNMAVKIADLADSVVRKEAERLARAHKPGWETIAKSALPAWIRRPLFLSMAIRAGIDPTSVRLEGVEPGDEFFEQYIANQLAVSAMQSLRASATFVAAFLNENREDLPSPVDKTVFTLANLTPPRRPRKLGVVVGLAAVLVGGLTALLGALIVGPSFGNPGGSFIYGSFLFLFAFVPTDARPKTSDIRWPGIRALVPSLAVGVGIGLVVGLTSGRTRGLVMGLAVGLAFGLVTGMARSKVVVTSPDLSDAYRLSLKSVLVMGPAIGVAVGMVVGTLVAMAGIPFGYVLMGLVLSLAGGLVASLDSGGWFVVSQRLVRHRLHQEGLFPRHKEIVGELEEMCRVGLMRHAAGGGSVRFTHDLIRDHLSPALPTAVSPRVVGSSSEGAFTPPVQ
jgi:hypothetical protein